MKRKESKATVMIRKTKMRKRKGRVSKSYWMKKRKIKIQKKIKRVMMVVNKFSNRRLGLL